jgi:hypothetical protein
MPTPKLLVSCLARNEAARFLPSALECWQDFADAVLLVDDSSTDNTRAIARSHGAIVHSLDDPEAMWGRESHARQVQFDLSLQYTEPGDYILILDADMCPARNPRELMKGSAGAWAFYLYDMWKVGMYRHDAFWQGHLHPRVWMFRRPDAQDWAWNARGIHCGHLPANFTANGTGVAPYDMGLLHFAYVDQELRAEKMAQYASQKHQLTMHEWKHAESIMDPNPRLVPLFFDCEYWLTKNDEWKNAA